MIREIPPLVLGIAGLVALVLLVLAWRVLAAAVVIVAVQWVVITQLDNATAVLVALTMPALLAGTAIASASYGNPWAHQGRRPRKVRH